MRRPALVPSVVIFFLLFLFQDAAPDTAFCQPLAPDTGGVRIGERETPSSEEEADRRLKEVLALADAAAKRYDSFALQFLCKETHRTIDYSRSAGEAKKDKETSYGYLLTIDPKASTYQVIRQTIDAEGRPTGSERVLDLSCPEPYLWTRLFLPTTYSTLRGRYLGREIQNYRLTDVVSFEGSAPRADGKDIREWSGLVWIEENTGSLVRVEARPSFQRERMLALWQEFQQSFTFPWGKAKARPHGYVVATVFDHERYGLLFPTRLDLTDFTWVAIGHEAVDSRLVLTYDDYRYFDIETTEKVRQP